MAGYNIVFRQLDFTIAAGITNVKSTLRGNIPRFRDASWGFVSSLGCEGLALPPHPLRKL